MDFLKKHGRFLGGLLVILGVLWYGWGEIAARAETVEKKRTQAKNKLAGHYVKLYGDATNDGHPANVTGMKLAAETQRTKELEVARNQLLVFEPDPSFTLAAVVNPDASIDDFKNYLYLKIEELKREFSYENFVRFNVEGEKAFGFQLKPEGLDKATIADYLYKIDICREVAACVKNAGVARLERFEFKGVEALSTRGLPTLPAQGETRPFLEPRLLVVEVKGREASLYNLMFELQRPIKGQLRERFLAIETFELKKEDLLEPVDDLVTATLSVVAYRVNEDAPLPDEGGKAATDQPTTGAPRRFR